MLDDEIGSEGELGMATERIEGLKEVMFLWVSGESVFIKSDFTRSLKSVMMLCDEDLFFFRLWQR